ncbi:MAG: hypothetical protein ABL903_17280 [Methylococcales bacterium]
MTTITQSRKALRTTIQFTALKMFLLTAGLNFSNIVIADDSMCSAVNAVFSVSSGLLCLPIVEVPTPSGAHYYNAYLQIIEGSNPLRFKLVNTLELPFPGFSNASFSPTSGILSIPAVELHETFGINKYSVSLQLQPNTTQTEFQLSPTIAAVIPTTYSPGKTWKPYVGLLDYEKAALNNLGYAQAYTDLAVAVYDFGIKSVGAWELKETADESSGMQAGAYVNKDSNEVTIAFRGTELCIIPIVCSFSEQKESGLDTYTDTILTQGHDSGQFDHAYKFAQKIINTYPNRKIVITGHSLGGGLAQAVGASFQLETYAFNASPVPNNFFNDHSVSQNNPAFKPIIHVLSDIHDPVSNTDYSGKVYADATHVTPPVFFDFDKKEIAPNYKSKLDDSRFNKHSMETLRDNIATVMQIYRLGW